MFWRGGRQLRRFLAAREALALQRPAGVLRAQQPTPTDCQPAAHRCPPTAAWRNQLSSNCTHLVACSDKLLSIEAHAALHLPPPQVGVDERKGAECSHNDA